MRIPTTLQVKKIYWKKAKGKFFSGLDACTHPSYRHQGFEKTKHAIPLRVSTEEANGVLVARIYYDGSVYEALNYGFHEENCHVPEQLGIFLDALQEEWPHLFFEPYNASIIDVTRND